MSLFSHIFVCICVRQHPGQLVKQMRFPFEQEVDHCHFLCGAFSSCILFTNAHTQKHTHLQSPNACGGIFTALIYYTCSFYVCVCVNATWHFLFADTQTMGGEFKLMIVAVHCLPFYLFISASTFFFFYLCTLLPLFLGAEKFKHNESLSFYCKYFTFYLFFLVWKDEFSAWLCTSSESLWDSYMCWRLLHTQGDKFSPKRQTHTKAGRQGVCARYCCCFL